MIGAIMDRVDKYLGRGRHSIAVPVMDGPLHPNNKLEEAEALFSAPHLDNLVALEGAVLFSSDAALMRFANGNVETVAALEAQITCLAVSDGGALAIGLDGTAIVLRGGAHDRMRIESLNDKPVKCPTAALFLNEDTLIVTIGARDRLHADWKRDLMEQGRTGEVWQIDLSTGTATRRADKLAYPYGVCKTPDGIAVSEAWGHRVLLLKDGGTPEVLLDELPGYPARIVAQPDGGYVLTMFAARNQLIEFVLREPEYLNTMMRQVHPDHWVAPALMWGQGFKEPMQSAALKTMGIIKPWAPTWSYGLVATLGTDFRPQASFHSRADGSRHGVTSACVLDGTIIAGSKGMGVALALSQTPAGGVL